MTDPLYDYAKLLTDVSVLRMYALRGVDKRIGQQILTVKLWNISYVQCSASTLLRTQQVRD